MLSSHLQLLSPIKIEVLVICENGYTYLSYLIGNQKKNIEKLEITFALASLAASASAAIARCNCTGRRTSLLKSYIKVAYICRIYSIKYLSLYSLKND